MSLMIPKSDIFPTFTDVILYAISYKLYQVLMSYTSYDYHRPSSILYSSLQAPGSLSYFYNGYQD